MVDPDATESPLEAAAGAAGPHAVDAFRLLSDETRMAILLALWEASDPEGTDDALQFSELYDRVGYDDTGNFNYHLGKLTGHFVAETDEGYELRNAGQKIVNAVIAGRGLGERTLAPTEIDHACHRCGGPVVLGYEDEYLYLRCTECEGNIGPDSTEQAPRGTHMVWDFDPAGLADRTPGELFVAGTIEFVREVGLLMRGVCPECSGAAEASLHVCESHEAPPGEVCPDCGTRDTVRVSQTCSVCKHGASFPAEAVVHDHPAVIAFCHEHGVDRTYDLDDPETCGELWEHFMTYEHELVSEDPVRIRVSVPAGDDVLHLTLDGDLDVIDVTDDRAGADGEARRPRATDAPEP